VNLGRKEEAGTREKNSDFNISGEELK
jgi:hypothetical protein